MSGILKMIRYSYILPRILIILIVYLFFYFFFDSILRIALIKSLESIFEAKVEISKVKTSFINPSIEIYNLSVGNKNDEFKNLFEFKKFVFSLKLKPLFEKKFVIENSILSGLAFNTPRRTSCKIKIEKTQLPPFVEKYIDELKSYAELRFDTIKSQAVEEIKFDFENLSSVKLLKEIEEKYNTDYKNISESINFDKYLDEIRKIQDDIDKVKREKNFIKQVKLAGEVKKRIEKLQSVLKNDKNDIERRISEIRFYWEEIEKAKKTDIQSILGNLKLPQIDRKSITRMIFGEKVYNQFLHYYSFFNTAQKYIPQNPKRMVFEEKRKRGRIIRFPKKENIPSFLLKNLSIDGYIGEDENKIFYKASVKNITNEPYLYQNPLLIELYGKNEKGYISLKSDIEIYNNKSRTIFEFKNMAFSGVKLGKNNFVIDLKKGFSDIRCEINTSSNIVDGKINVFFHDILVNSDVKINEKIDNIIKNTISSIKGFNLSVFITGKLKEPSISIESDIGDIISESMTKEYKKEVEGIKKKIEEKINVEIERYKKRFEEEVLKKKQELKEKINEKTGEIEKKIQDLLKNIKI